MFNSREYAWSDVTVMIGTRILTGIRSVSYKRKQEKEAIYGKGDQPVSIQRGNVSYEGSISLLQSEYEALKQAGNGSVLDLNVNIVVSYGHPELGDLMKTDRLMGCEFTEEGSDIKQGDKNQEIELPFIFLRLQ